MIVRPILVQWRDSKAVLVRTIYFGVSMKCGGGGSPTGCVEAMKVWAVFDPRGVFALSF